MPDKQPVEALTFEELLARIAQRDESCWEELLRRDCSLLPGENDSRLGRELKRYYNRIRGAGRTFDDVIQEMVIPRRKGEPSYLQKAIIDVQPTTEKDYRSLAKRKFKQRLIDEARREVKHQIVLALQSGAEVPADSLPGIDTEESWQSVRNAVAGLDDVEKAVTRCYYGIPATLDDGEPQEAMAVAAVAEELQRKGIQLSYQQTADKLKKARRLLGVLLLPVKEALDKD